MHEALGDSIADVLPVNVAVLLSEEAKRVARRGHTPISPGAGAAPAGTPARGGGDAVQSPWRVGSVQGYGLHAV